MKYLTRIRRIFSLMPLREKIAVVILITIFLVYLGQTVLKIFRFPLTQEKGVFTEGITGHIKSLNPLFVDFNETDRDASQLIFSGLIKYDPAQKNFFPDLAQKWERSRNGLIYTFTLRENLKWHDVTPLTADDIVFTFKHIIQNPAFRNPMLKNAFEGISVRKTGTTTIDFILPKVNSYFISNLTVGILPKHLLENANISNLDKDPFNKHPVGSGPYKIISTRLNQDGDRVDLEAFPEYYGQKPAMPRIRIYTFPNERTLVKEIGALHASTKLSAEAIKEIGSNERFSIFQYTLNQFTALYFNTDNEFLRDKNTRQALSLALPKNELIGEQEQRVDSLDLLSHPDEPSFAFNLNQAKKLLDDAGFKVGTQTEGYRVNSKGEKMSFTLLVHSKIPNGLSDKIKSAWKELGVQIQINREDKNFYQYVTEKRYDMLLIRQNLGYNRDVYPLFNSSQIGSDGLNFGNFRSFRTDGLTEAIRKEKNPADKEKLLQELSRVIADEKPVIFISTPVYFYALDKKISAFPVTSLDFHSDRFSIMPYLPSTLFN